MTDMNAVIINNIQTAMRNANIKQVALAEKIHTTKQTVSKMLTGARTINAVELAEIAEALHVPVDTLVKLPERKTNTNAVIAFMGKVNTEEARNGLKTLDRIADMILFYTDACENGEAMMKSWEA